MVFNSSQNSFNSKGSQAESFEVLRNSYNLSEGGYDYQPALRPVHKDYMYPSAVHASMTHYNQKELQYLNHDTMRTREELSGNGFPRHMRKVMSKEELVGEGIFKKIRKTANKASSATKKAANKTSSATKKAAKTGAKVTRKTAEKVNRDTKPLQKSIAKSVTDEDGLLHKAIGKTLDVAIPAAGEALGAAASTYFTGDPTMGAMVGKKAGQLGRSHLKSKTGYGAPGVGEYAKGNVDLAKTLRKYAPEYKNDMLRQKKPDVVRRVKPVNGRCEVVKQIMKEKRISLPEASKYVKKNNLW